MAPNSARQLDANDNGGNMPSSLGRAGLHPDLSGLESSTRARVEDVMSRMPANNSSFYREDPAHGAEGGHAEGDHGGHGAPAKKKPAIKTVDVDLADAKAAFDSIVAANEAFNEGVLDKPTLTRALDDTLDAVPIPGTQKLRYALPLIMWVLGKTFNIPDHKPEKVKVDYDNLSSQILTMHPDKGRPNSFHHGMVGLLMSMEEAELRVQYSSFFEQETFSSSIKTSEGRKELKDEFTGLFGKKVKTRAQFLVRSRQMLERMGATFVNANPDSAVAHMHPLREQHANHSLHVLQMAIENARAWVTDANIGQITKNVEDIKLNKDMNKFGDTLMEHVKGNTDLATQFLGNINLPAFNKAFHSILSDNALEESMYDEPKLVKEQICQAFNFSPEENISANDLNAFTTALIGPATLVPGIAPAPARYDLDPENAGALGPRSAIPPTDTDTLAKYDAIRTSLNEARTRLLAIPDGATLPIPPALPPTRLSVLFPPKSTEIKYPEFGVQLRRAVRGKSGTNLQRARTHFLRGWEDDEFQNEFSPLVDTATLAAAVAGSKAEKDDVKNKIYQVTGLKGPKITRTQFTNRINALRGDLGTIGATVGNVDGDVIAKRGALDALLVSMLAPTPGCVESQIESLYLDVNLEEKLGEALQSATDGATVTAILDRIDVAFLYGHYPRVMQTEAAVMGPPPMSLTNQQLFKAQVAAFIGAPKGFVWTDAAVTAMTGGLRAKLALVPVGHTGRAIMETWINHISGPVGGPPGFSPTLITHLGTLP